MTCLELHCQSLSLTCVSSVRTSNLQAQLPSCTDSLETFSSGFCSFTSQSSKHCRDGCIPLLIVSRDAVCCLESSGSAYATTDPQLSVWISQARPWRQGASSIARLSAVGKSLQFRWLFLLLKVSGHAECLSSAT